MFVDDRQDEFFCPICGEFDPFVVQGKHICSTLPTIKAEESELPYGQQLEDGFLATNPYGDSNYGKTD